MNPEQLKVIAEGVGHETKVTPSRCAIKTYPYAYCPNLEKWKLYDPLKNNDQMAKVLAELIKVGFLLDGCHRESENDYMMWREEQDVHEGKTINEAVCNAGFKHFSQNNISKS